MDAGRLEGYRVRARDALRVAVAADHPPRLIALSFAIGLFLTALPTLGIALLVLAWLGYRCEWANGLAFVAAAAIMNPLAKTSVYVASLAVGSLLLGPIPGLSRTDISVTAGSAVLVRLLVGNLLLALGFAILGYGLALYLVRAVRHRGR